MSKRLYIPQRKRVPVVRKITPKNVTPSGLIFARGSTTTQQSEATYITDDAGVLLVDDEGNFLTE